MCILTYVPAGVDVPWQDLFNGACANPDGHGWAVARGDELVIGKSMDMFEAAAGYEQALKDLPGAVSLFHSRIATAGTVNEFNVHPFYVGGGDKTVMAHNGILPSRWQPERTDDRSDTRLFADQMGWLIDNDRGVPSRRMGRRLGEAIGTYNKLVFISVAAGHPMVRIINSHIGVWTNGVWHSNRTFESYRPSSRRPNHRLSNASLDPTTHWSEWKPEPLPERSTPRYGSPYGGSGLVTTSYGNGYNAGGWRQPYDWAAEQSDNEECYACKGLNIDPGGYCTDCNLCQDCLWSTDKCDCHVPRSAKDKDGEEWDEVDRWLEVREKETEEERTARWARQDAEWEAYLEEKRLREEAKKKQAGETWDEFILRQQEARKAEDAARKAALSRVLGVETAPLMIEQ